MGETTEHDGCDCTELCSMGPTCPGGMLARLPGSGCGRTGETDPVRSALAVFVESDAVQYALTVAEAGHRTEAIVRLRDAATQQAAIYTAPEPAVAAETPVYCADCDVRGVETRMVPDTDWGGHLCPVCEPMDVSLIGRPDERLARYDRLRTPQQAEAIREIGRAIREVANRSEPVAAETLTEAEKRAVDLASSVFGWQHLVRYSGQSKEWLNTTLVAIVRAAREPAQRADLTARLTDPDVIEAVARVLPLDFERHESQTIKDAALGDRRRLARRVLAAVRDALTGGAS